MLPKINLQGILRLTQIISLFMNLLYTLLKVGNASIIFARCTSKFHRISNLVYQTVDSNFNNPNDVIETSVKQNMDLGRLHGPSGHFLLYKCLTIYEAIKMDVK